MKTAYDIMTRALATVTPDTPIWQAARLMRDLNIGDVLVVEGQSLKGIVTDRDLAVNALASSMDPRNETVSKYMTGQVVTGEPEWDLTKLADVMGQHQIRRMPIVKNGELIGIVSLGDLALHTPKERKIARSLRDISESSALRRTQLSPAAALLGLAFTAIVATTAAVFFFSGTRSGKRFRKQLEKADVQKLTRQALKNKELQRLTRDAVMQTRRLVDQVPVSDLTRNIDQALKQTRHTMADVDMRDMAHKGLDYARQQSEHLQGLDLREMADQGIKYARHQVDGKHRRRFFS